MGRLKPSVAKPKLPCRGCGTLLSAGWLSGVCRACKSSHCRRCHNPIDPARGCGYCPPCLKDRNTFRRSHSGRPCYGCGEPLPPGRKADLCNACNRSDRALRYPLMKKRRRHCRDCGDPMPVGRVRSRCTACWSAHWKKTGARHPCAICGHPVRLPTQSYCLPCHQMRQNRRRLGKEKQS